jgi:transcriptional regulator with XRE-family HTH domain
MSGNVLQRSSRPTKKSYRAAIKRIVLDLQAQHGLNDEELAERVGCSSGTIANARKEQNNLDGVTLASVEFEFGPGAIDPFLALGMSRGVPQGAHCDTDPNPALKLSEALTALIATQQPGSHMGIETSDEEAAKILRSLREGRAALDALIARGERHIARAILTAAGEAA